MADNFDKFLPDWQIGTLTLVANSTDFAASDALLTFGSIQQGDFIISPDGRMLVIESITDDNSGVLSSPCPSEAAGTFQTRIRYQSDNSRYTGQTAALRRLMSGGNLFALAKLAGDAEKIVRFLGSGAFDLVDPSEFGIQDPHNSLAKLAALTLTARQILQTDENGALKTLALAANKFLRTDANGDLALSDLGTAAIALLNLSGDAAADRLPYLTGANGAGLTALTAYARSILDDPSGAAMFATMGATQSLAQTGYCKLPNGWLAQCTRVAPSNDSTLNWPTAFADTNYVVVGSLAYPSLRIDQFVGINVEVSTPSSFTVRRREILATSVATPAGGYPIFVIGIGKAP